MQHKTYTKLVDSLNCNLSDSPNSAKFNIILRGGGGVAVEGGHNFTTGRGLQYFRNILRNINIYFLDFLR